MEEPMEEESKRLQTFFNWSNRYPVTAESLARAGFYYVGDGHDDRVACSFCNLKLENWEIGDIPEEEHRRHSPNCKFMSNPRTTHNLPYSQQISEPPMRTGEQEVGQSQGHLESGQGHLSLSGQQVRQPFEERSQSSPGHQEQSGYAHLSSSGQQVSQPSEAQSQKSSEQEVGNSNVYYSIESRDARFNPASTQEQGRREGYGTQATQQFKYSTYKERLESFPNDWKQPSKEKMADSGFYHKGKGHVIM